VIRAVLDTNALASGAVASSGTLAMLIDAWQNGDFSVIISFAILHELERTLSKPYFALCRDI
jgi:predicted nucleic acid-binding protein